MKRIEQWRDIPGHPHYQASNMGRIRSLDHQTAYTTPQGHNKTITKHGKILKPKVSAPRNGSNRGAALRVSIWEDGKAVSRTVHSLVMLAWVGPRPTNKLIRHLDDDYTNNKVRNLRYGTPRENQLDSVRLGNHTGSKKTKCPRGHRYTAANTYMKPTKAGGFTRNCRTCGRERARARKQRTAT